MDRKNENDERYRYCCGCFHVERGAYVVGAIGIVFGILSVMGALIEGKAPNVLSAVINTLLCVCVILAQHQRQPNLYLPFLIVTAIGTVIFIALACLCLFFALFAPYEWEKYAEDSQLYNSGKRGDYAAARLALLIIALLVAAGAALNVWLWRMVYLAYEFMKLQIAPNVPPKYSVV